MADKKTYRRPDLYQQVTDKVIAALEAGDLPWYPSKMWSTAGCNAAPYNAVSGRSYRGYNQLNLMDAAVQLSTGRIDPRFCSFKQAKEAGWRIKKGAKSLQVVLFKQVRVRTGGEADAGDGGEPKRKRGSLLTKIAEATAGAKKEADTASPAEVCKTVWVLRAFNVFHASQIDGIPPLDESPVPWTSNAVAQDMLAALKAQGMAFLSGGDKASYNWKLDRLRMPEKASFASALDHDAVLFHELLHATGAAPRLNRADLLMDWEAADDESFKAARAREELVAEMASAMLCSQLGVSYDTDRHAQYIDSWLKALKGDKKLVLKAAGMASKACDYLIGLVPHLDAQMLAHRRDESGIDVQSAAEVDLEELAADGGDADLAEVSEWIDDVAATIGFEAGDDGPAEVIDIAAYCEPQPAVPPRRQAGMASL